MQKFAEVNTEKQQNNDRSNLQEIRKKHKYSPGGR